MKKHTTLKSKFSSAFSLVELLVVIAVIAVIAAIAIPNITDITSGATTASNQRQAQNIASVASAYKAAGGSLGTGTKEEKIATIDATAPLATRMVGTQPVTFNVGTIPTGATAHLMYLDTELNYVPSGGRPVTE